MKIVLLGPPGSGKGVQASRLQDRFGVPHISIGRLLRDEVARQTRLGRKVMRFLEAGELAPDALVEQVLLNRLDFEDAQAGFILDGFPRTIEQAGILDELLAGRDTEISDAVLIEVEIDVILDRLADRAVEEGRSDDREVTILHRIELYEEQETPVAEYYSDQDKLVEIYGVGEPEEVFGRIVAMLHDSEAALATAD